MMTSLTHAQENLRESACRKVRSGLTFGVLALMTFVLAGCDLNGEPPEEMVETVTEANRSATPSEDSGLDQEIVHAADALNEFEAACAQVEPIWPVELCGEVVLIDPRSRLAVANHPAPDESFEAHGGVYVGSWPADKGVANTGFEWDGEMWAMAMLPLPEERFSRLRLLSHESFHRIQPALGHVIADPMARHLDEEAGRVWLRLEIHALAHALNEFGAEAHQAVADAMLFRQVRHDTFPDAAEIERQLEAHEGLAEYTGVRFALDATDADMSAAAEHVKAFEHRPTYMRSLGYGTGPALGLLLDRYAPDWREDLPSEPDLAALLAAALQAPELEQEPEARLQKAERRAATYHDKVIRAEENERAERLATERADYRKQLVEGPVLVIDPPELRLMFNPNTVLSMGEQGDVYPGAILMGPWGQLTLEEGGALAPAERDRARVAAPEELQPDADGKVHGPGWTLQLEPGWRLAPGPRESDVRLEEDAQH